METAANLDPDNALIRSYLGKAYYEQRRGDIASTEYAIAKKLDPKDPTPWFYDAIYKQTVNRPVEALHDMQKAIELNDNRAVFRSKLLLDEDLAARSAALGRIYNDLGFQQRGLLEGWKSVNEDPSNYSAHRLLADIYAALPRHEIARVSELLQSQLLQPINITPVQTTLSESNLLILDGLGRQSPSFNEFNPLFARNRAALQVSGIFGNNQTYGDEVTHSGLWNKFSYSLGQFHYETDGFRENNDVEQDLYNIFAQYMLTPEFNIQAEYRLSEIDRGDIDINFDKKDFSRTDRYELNQDTVRVGSHYAPSENSDFIMSFIYSNQDGMQTQIRPTNFPEFNQEIKEDNEEDGYQAELRYLFHNKWFDFTTGGGVSIVNGETITSQSLLADPCPVENCQRDPTSNDINTRHYNGYIYTDTHFPKNLTWSVGLSLDSFEDKPFDFTSLNPKFGLQWKVMDRILLRLAAFKTLKRVLLVDQTVEPTQIAGFNQFFDDRNGTKSVLYGVGFDINFTQELYGGMEVSVRDLKIPTIIPTIEGDDETISFEDQKEELYKAYLYWTPNSNLAFSIEPQYEKYKNKEITIEPNMVNTFTFPITARYFNELGFFSKISLTYLHQNVNQQLSSGQELSKNDEKVFLLDTGIGYRFPKRLGLISLEVNNILDEKFQFQDNNFRLTQKRNRTVRFVPDRSIFAKVTINF
jgi:tetratricopeptide (TPR) repeat protein